MKIIDRKNYRIAKAVQPFTGLNGKFMNDLKELFNTIEKNKIRIVPIEIFDVHFMIKLGTFWKKYLGYSKDDRRVDHTLSTFARLCERNTGTGLDMGLDGEEVIVIDETFINDFLNESISISMMHRNMYSRSEMVWKKALQILLAISVPAE